MFLVIWQNLQEHTCAWACNFIKNETLTQVFSCEFCKFLWTPFYGKPLGECFCEVSHIHFLNEIYKLDEIRFSSLRWMFWRTSNYLQSTAFTLRLHEHTLNSHMWHEIDPCFINYFWKILIIKYYLVKSLNRPELFFKINFRYEENSVLKIKTIHKRSSLFYNMSAKHKRHECYTNDTNVTRVQHEWKVLILITTQAKTYFHTPILAIWQVIDYKERNNFIPITTFWKCLVPMPKYV